jgi:hypothetical protein
MSAPHAKSDRPPAANTGGAAGTATDRKSDLDSAGRDDDTWRHERVAPVDEKNPLKSLGRAVADTLTGGAEAGVETGKPKR